MSTILEFELKVCEHVTLELLSDDLKINEGKNPRERPEGKCQHYFILYELDTGSEEFKDFICLSMYFLQLCAKS